MDRRQFVKISGIGLAAIGSGIGTGTLLKSEEKKTSNFSAFAFLPADNEAILSYLTLFQHRIRSKTFSDLIESKNIADIVKTKFLPNNKNSFLNEQYYDIKLIKINQKVSSDIFISDSSKIVLDPDIDFENELLKFRESINQKPATYLLSLELKEKSLLPDLNPTKNKLIKIENSSGLFDKLSTSANYTSITIPGSIGKTELSLKEGKLSIKNSPCKHKLCKIMAELSGSNKIACVPNKVLITLS